MPESALARHRLVLEAVSFAARAHRHQVRKDGQTPYVAHPFRVCLIIRHVFGIDDPEVLAAALLHDTIEDTTTDFDDIEERFGRPVADTVVGLTKDMRLPEAEREAAYMSALSQASPAVKVAKLADMFDNLSDCQHLPAQGKERTLRRLEGYLAALERDLPAVARGPFALVRQLLEEVRDSAVTARAL